MYGASNAGGDVNPRAKMSGGDGADWGLYISM